MTKNYWGIEVPGGGDAFDPQGDMVELGASVAGRVIVPVANQTEADTLRANVVPTAAVPLFVFLQDTTAVRRHDGTRWYDVVPADVTGVITYNSSYGPKPTQPLTFTQRGNRITIAGGFTSLVALAGWSAYAQLSIGNIAAPFRPPAAVIWNAGGIANIAGVGFYASMLLIQPDGTVLWQPGSAQGSSVPAGNLTTVYYGEVLLPV